jgi:hypothetical protein
MFCPVMSDYSRIPTVEGCLRPQFILENEQNPMLQGQAHFDTSTPCSFGASVGSPSGWRWHTSPRDQQSKRLDGEAEDHFYGGTVRFSCFIYV